MPIGKYISIITLNAKGLNQNTQTESEEMKKKIFHANGNQRKARVAIFISDKIDLKIKKIKRNNEGHYMMIKGSIQEEDITILSIYAPHIGAPQYVKQTLTDIKGEIDSNTIVVGDLTFHLHQWTEHQNRKLIRKQSVK